MMAGSMRVSTREARKVQAVSKCARMAAFMKVSSRTMSSMDTVSLLIPPAIRATRVSGKMERCMVKDCIFGLTAVATKASTRMIKRMVSAFTCGPMDEHTTECGRTACRMERVLRCNPILK